MSEIDVERTARDFWATRPRRRASDRKIAGVAAAIGRRYAIDPILVRVAFVVAALGGGAGFLLYLLGWLFLPEEGPDERAEVSGAESVAGRGRGPMSAALTIILVILMILVSAGVLSSHGSGVIGLAVGLGALLLLHRARGSMGEMPASAPPVGPHPKTETETGPAAPAPSAQASEDPDKPSPPAWDPLGAAPFAWDLPEPSPQPEPTAAQRKLDGIRSKITPVTLGLALLAGGLALALGPGLSGAQVAATLLGVVGLGMVAGSFLRGGRGLIAIAIPLAVLTWALSAIPIHEVRVGNSDWNAPISAGMLQDRYSVTLGNANLDLTKLRLAKGHTARTSVTVGVGETHIYLPRNINVQLSCQTQLGDVDCLGRTDPSGLPSRVTVFDPGRDGANDGTLSLDVRAVAGQVHVDREDTP